MKGRLLGMLLALRRRQAVLGVMAKAGVSDLEKYAVSPGSKLMKDFFL